MMIFIDESGIHKKIDHSTFALVYIEIKNYKVVEKKIQDIEDKMNIDTFHWSSTCWKNKEIFLDEALKLDFSAKVAVVKNPIDPSEKLEECLTHIIIEKNIINIFIDGKKPKWYEKRIKKILREKNITTKKLRTIKDEQCAGVRLADMAAGLVRSYFDGKNKKRISKYYKKLEKKSLLIIKT